jgi:hypothetical protein
VVQEALKKRQKLPEKVQFKKLMHLNPKSALNTVEFPDDEILESP